MKKWVILACFLTFPSLAANDESAAKLFISCDNKTASCYDYLLGFADGFASGQLVEGIVASKTPPAPYHVCFPSDGVIAEQVRLIFIKWSQSHPEMLHLAKSAALTAALEEAFPCKPAG